jgi:CBS domain-containing protein
MKVKEIMNSPVETIGSETTITKAAEIMKSSDVGVLPVIKEDEIVGIITDRDIVVRAIAEKLNPQNTPVKKVMTADVVCCFEDTDMEEAARMLEDKKVHRLLVLGDNNTISGILSIADITRKMKDEHLLYEILERICEPANV